MKLIEGLKLQSIHFSDDSCLEINDNCVVVGIDDLKIKSIIVTIEGGEMLSVPWAEVLFFDGSTHLVNLNLAESVKPL